MPQLVLTRQIGTSTFKSLTLVYSEAPIVQSITEFNSAVRLGSASQDDRNLASFITIEDGRSGLGQRYADIREDLDKLYWTTGAVHLRFQELIKPPAFGLVTFGSKTNFPYRIPMIESDISGVPRYYVGNDQTLYYSSGTGHAMTASTNQPHAGGTPQAISELMLYTPVSGGSAGVQLMVAGGLTQLAWAATPTTGAWSTAAQEAQSLFEFDGKLWLMGRRSLSWTIDMAAFTAETGNWPQYWEFIGVYPYGQNNFMPYVLIHSNVTMSRNASRARIAILDVDNNQLVPLELGLSGVTLVKPLGDQIGIIHNYGRSISLYNPLSRQIRNQDWNALSRHGFTNTFEAVDLVLGPTGQLCVLAGYATIDYNNPSSTDIPCWWVHNGAGWHRMAPGFSGLDDGGTQVKLVSPVAGGKYISHLSDLLALCIPDTSDGSVTRLQAGSLPWREDPFKPGQDMVDLVEPALIRVETPWYDAGFANLEGALLAMYLGGYADDNVPIWVYYQKNDDESAWTLVGVFPNSSIPAAPYEITDRDKSVAQSNRIIFRLGSGTTTLHGISFRRVRFRFELRHTTSGGTPITPYRTPNAFPITLQFLKRPDMRDSYRYVIDVEETLRANYLKQELVTVDEAAEITQVRELAKELRLFYNSPTMLQCEWADMRTYGFITSFPRIFEVSGGNDDVALSAGNSGGHVKGGTFVLTIAEPQ